MRISISALRWLILGAILAVSLWIIAQQVGLVADSCTRECDAIRGTFLATVLPSLSALLAVVLGVGLIRDWKVESVRRTAAAVAVCLMAYALMQGAFCRPCFAVNTLWIALAATELKPKIALATTALALGSVVMIFLTLENLSSEARAPKVALLALRGQETKLKGVAGNMLVLFLDPACPHCRQSFGKFYEKRDRILVRWLIMSSHFEVVKNVAALAESRFGTDRTEGWNILRRWYESPASASPNKANVEAFIVQERSSTNPTEALAAIAQDGKLAEQLDLQAVPGFAAVMELSPSKIAAERISKKAFNYLLDGQQ